MQYMRAHGNTAGPTQRPVLTGVIGSLVAFVPFEIVLRASGARSSVAQAFDLSMWESSVISLIIMVFAGIAYAWIFKRAANDCEGGWLFGASFGFIVWMIAPITLWQLVSGEPVAVGTAAIGLFGAHVVYGLALGLAFPWIHFLIQSRLEKDNDRRNGFKAQEKGDG